jgi:hypothetical protein
MNHEPTEDVPYEIDDFALEDESTIDNGDEEQTAETKVIQEIRKYLKDNIASNNSFDVLNLPQNAKPEEKIAVFDEMFNYKGVVHHLRQIEQIINNKVKEN